MPVRLSCLYSEDLCTVAPFSIAIALIVNDSTIPSSDMKLVESALKTLAVVLSKVKGCDSWPLVQELLVYLCTLLDPKLAAEAGE